MKKIIIILNIAFLVLSYQNANSQNNGFAGKRFLLKTDAIDGFKSVLSGYSLETVINRHLTVTVGFNYFKHNVIQKYSEFESDGLYDELDKPMPQKALVKTKSISLELRKYYGQLPAPHGIFNYVTFNTGSLNIIGDYYTFLLDSDAAENEIVTYHYNGLKFNSLALGTGYQTFIFKNIITLGFKTGFVYTKVYPNYSDRPAQVISGFVRNYGPNIWSLPKNNNIEPVKSSIGVQAFFQIGFLLF